MALCASMLQADAVDYVHAAQQHFAAYERMHRKFMLGPSAGAPECAKFLVYRAHAEAG